MDSLMLTGKRSVSFNKHTLGVIEKASEIWPEVADNFSGLIAAVVSDWDRIRANGGGKGQQINARLDRHEMFLLLICARLEIKYIPPSAESETTRQITPWALDYSRCDNPPVEPAEGDE